MCIYCKPTLTCLFMFAFIASSAATPLAPSIIDGDNAWNTTYQISIQVGIFDSYSHDCGAVLISPNWIITAAHCIRLELLLSRIVAGAVNLTDMSQAQIRYIDLENIIMHPNYTEPPNNDLALIKVDEPFELTETVQPIPLSKVFCTTEDPVMFSGWGVIGFNESFGIPAELLQIANLSLIEFNACANLLDSFYGGDITIAEDKHVCTASDPAPCLLDDGGPLVQEGKLIGILSLLPAPCSSDSIPSVFINIGYYYDFIRTYVHDLVK